MTDKLTQLMHERAETMDFTPPDLAEISAVGNRTIRRRRRLGVTAVAGVLVLAVGVPAAVVLGGGTPGDAQVTDRARTGAAESPAGAPAVSPIWAIGDVIHDGDRTIDVGHDIDAFVSTWAGFVFAADGVVYEADGQNVTKIGTIDKRNPRLVADDGRPQAGWVQGSGDEVSFVVFDLSTRTTATVPDLGHIAPGRGHPDSGAWFSALDDGTAYVVDDRGAVAIDVESGRETAMAADAIDVQAGQIAFWIDDRVEVGPAAGEARPLPAGLGGSGVLSPRATYYAGSSDQALDLTVVRVADGSSVTPALGDYFHVYPYAWLSENSLAVLAHRTETSPLELLACEIPAGDCQVLLDGLGSADQAVEAGFLLPNGLILKS